MTDTPMLKMEPPSWVVRRLTYKGGTNVYGRPNFRVIWGGNRTRLVGGKFKKVIPVDNGKAAVVTEVAEMRELLAYHPFRWHLERWCPPAMYGSQEEWYERSWDEDAQLHTMGPYPHEGDYEHCFYLAQCPHMKPGDKEWCRLCIVSMGEFIPLDENVHILEMIIHSILRSQDISKMEERDALFMREDIKRQENRKRVTERVMGAMRPTLATQPTSWQDGTRCSVPEAKMTARPAYLPHNRRGISQSTRSMPAQKQKQLEEE